MNYRSLLSFSSILILSLPLVAQDSELSSDEASSTSQGSALARARRTIDEADSHFQQNQDEVLAAEADSGIPAEGAPETEGISEEADSEIDSAEEASGSIDNPASDGIDDPAGDAVSDEPEPAVELPDSIDSEEIAVGEVYMDFDEEERASSMSREDDTISVDFPDEDVRTIIRNVADLYDLNVVIPDTLVGSVSLKLRDVSWRQVFDVVLEPLNFTWIEDRNIIKIKSRDELLAEPVATHVYVINFARAGEIQASIAPLVDSSAGGRIQVDTRSNALVITERPSRMNNIQAIIERLDRPTDQVMIESKFVEITRRDTTDLGINWTSLSGYQLDAGPFSRDYTGENSSESTKSSTFREGTVFDPDSGEFETDFEDSVERGRIDTDSEARLDTAVFSADAFSVILSALENNNDVELVSNPTVVTMNNAPAQINIGEEFPIPSYTYNQEQGSFEVSGFEYKPIGIILNVTPQVNSAGFVNLNIAPEISSRTDEVSFGGASGASIPIITTRKTESTVTIKSGFTLAIGGLMESRTGNNSNKVPLLGDIPLFGRLFKSSNESVETRNLIIFITAKVLNPDGSTYQDVFSEQTLYEMGISDRDVPGFEPSADEQALYSRVREERDAIEAAENRATLQRQLDALDRLRQKEGAEPPAAEPSTDASSIGEPEMRRDSSPRPRRFGP